MKSGLRSNSSRARTCCYQLVRERNHRFWLYRTLTSLEAANPCVWSVLGCKSFQNPCSSPLPLKVPVFGVKDIENSGVEPKLTKVQTEGLEGRGESCRRFRWDGRQGQGHVGGSNKI